MNPPREIALFDLPHRRARALLATGVPVYLSVDPVEYHGPHLSLHNDRIVSRAIARDIHAALHANDDVPFVVAENLEVGFEPTPGAGSREVSFAALRELIVTACEALADLGATRLVLMTFHGSPLHSIALQHGVDAFIARGGRALCPMTVLLNDLTTLDSDMFPGALAHVPEPDRTEMRETFALDFHAGFGETSIALHYAPDSVDDCYKTLRDCPRFECPAAFANASRIAHAAGRVQFAREVRFAGYGLAWSRLRPFPGYTGKPRYARAASGEIIARYIVERSARACRDVFDGAPPPEPIMKWMAAATLSGRIPGLHVPLSDVARFDGASSS